MWIKKAIYSLAVLGLVFSMSFSGGLVLAQEETILDTDMVHFVMHVQWGNARGEVTDKAETNFDGSISLSDSSVGHVSLIRTLLFEEHNDTADKITSKMNPISWNSLIYGHWDGLRAMVSSPANGNISVVTTQGTVTKTAKEFREMKEPFVYDAGNGKEIVIKVHPAPKRAFIAKIIWGNIEKADYLSSARDCDEAISKIPGAENTTSIRPDRCRNVSREDFSGSLMTDGNSMMKFLREIRFEGSDKVTSKTDTKIEWDSVIFGGVDGVLVRFNLNRDIDRNGNVTLSFPALGWTKSIPLLKLYHEKNIKVKIKDGYGVWISLWQHPDRRLIRAKDDFKVYVMEDGLRRHIPNPRVFEDQGLNWDDVEEVDTDEVEVLPESDALSYTEGTLVQGDGPEVYAISNGEKRHVKDPAVFAKLQYDWTNIVKVDNAELSIYSSGASLDENSDYADSTLVRENGKPTVYVVQGDKLVPITSLDAFNSHNYRWNRVKVVESSVVADHRIAGPLELGDGSLVRDPNGKIYIINHGVKQYVRTMEDLNKAGFKSDRIINVSHGEIDDLEDGEDIVAEDVN